MAPRCPIARPIPQYISGRETSLEAVHPVHFVVGGPPALTRIVGSSRPASSAAAPNAGHEPEGVLTVHVQLVLVQHHQPRGNIEEQASRPVPPTD
jgi:hypothetical protein